MIPQRARQYLAKIPYLRRAVRAYYRLRYLPRDTIGPVARMSGDVARLSVATANMHAELTEFSDGATSALLKLDAGLRQIVPQFGAIRESIRGLEARLAVVEAHRGTAGGEDLPAIRSLVAQQAHLIERIDRAVARQAMPSSSHLWAPAAGDRVRSILSLLKPVTVRDVAKLRVGRDHDGGYVMLDDFAGIEGALSLGIADDVSWDTAIAAHGIAVLQFDPSIATPPEPHALFRFEPLRVAASDEAGAISLDTIVATRLGSQSGPLLLKIDIEGNEWDVFAAAADSTLRRFKQIVCEFHDLDRLHEADFGDRARTVFARLVRTHAVCHVHGNNCGNFANVANVVVPQSLEVSFAARAHYAFADSAEVFPTDLDRPNEPGRADLYLGRFQF